MSVIQNLEKKINLYVELIDDMTKDSNDLYANREIMRITPIKALTQTVKQLKAAYTDIINLDLDESDFYSAYHKKYYDDVLNLKTKKPLKADYISYFQQMKIYDLYVLMLEIDNYNNIIEAHKKELNMFNTELTNLKEKEEVFRLNILKNIAATEKKTMFSNVGSLMSFRFN